MTKKVDPPKLFSTCFKWFCNDEYFEELQGDLEEAFYSHVENYGVKEAERLYRREVMLMLRPSVIKKLKTQINYSNNIDMLRNYVKVALRNMLKQRVYAIINILGLVIGMAATILISLYIQDELSYDKYHSKADRIYRLSREWLNQNGETSLHLGHLAPPFAPRLKSDFEGIVEQVVRVINGQNPVMEKGENKFEQQDFYFADPELFDIFSWKFIVGDKNTALQEPLAVVLSESAAVRYFGDEDPMGKSITLSNFGQSAEMKITGIIEDAPSNSHFHYQAFGSMRLIEMMSGPEAMEDFGSNNFTTYVLFKDKSYVNDFKAQLPAFIDKHLGMNNNGDGASNTNKLNLMPLTDIHLHSNLDSEMETNGDIRYIYVSIVVAIFILVIACINFVNLSTARSMKRAKEVGVRKVMGAFRSALINQFIAESMITAIISAVMAIILVHLILPFFNLFALKQLSLTGVSPTFLMLLTVGVVVVVGVLAGSYPAFVLSKFQPAKVLKSLNQGRPSRFNLRSALVVFQFFISICLIIGVGVIGDQVEYMKTKDKGFDETNVLVLPMNQKMYQNFEDIKSRLMQQPSISQVSLGSRVPSGKLNDSQGCQAEVDGGMKSISFRLADIEVDHGYLDMLGVKFLAGRNFDKALASDSMEAFVLNKIAIEQIGWFDPEEAIGKKINYGKRKGYVVGVVDNFHFEAMYYNIAPMIFKITGEKGSNMMVRTKAGQREEALAYLKEEWTALRPDNDFDYYTIQDRYDAQYVPIEKLGQLVTYFSWLAVFIAILGLFGLSSFSIEQNIKEIGIRKVLGASVKSILMVFTGRFTLLVVIGMLLAIPVSYLGMQYWLDNFPYTTALKPLTFIVGGVVAIVLALVTVSYETIKAALSNPVDSLRNE